MELKKSWARAWEMGSKAAKEYDSEDAAIWAMDMDTLENFECIHGFGAFFHAGFIGRKPEWVEAIRYGEIPASGYSINWADGSAEPGVSCVKIIRNGDDENCDSIYDVTLGWQGRDKIRVAGWWLGLPGSDGEPCLLGAVKVSD
jgi:hypothetical protein